MPNYIQKIMIYFFTDIELPDAPDSIQQIKKRKISHHKGTYKIVLNLILIHKYICVSFYLQMQNLSVVF